MLKMLIPLVVSLAAVALLLLRYRAFRRRLDAESDRKAVERFQALMMSYNEASRVAMDAALEVRHMTEQEFKLVVQSAECVLWHADVEDVGGSELKWDLRAFAEEKGDFVRIEQAPMTYRVGAWYHGRSEAEMFKMADRATAAIRGGSSGYRQEFLCRAKDGQPVWFQEDTRIEQMAPGKWRLFGVSMDITERKRAEEQRERLVRELTEAMAQVKQLRGMLPICASCKKIRDDAGYWSQIETYIHKHTDVEFSHSVCPDCFRKLYPEYSDEADRQRRDEP